MFKITEDEYEYILMIKIGSLNSINTYCTEQNVWKNNGEEIYYHSDNVNPLIS